MFQLQISAAADFWSDFGCGIHLVSGIVDDSPARRSLSSVFLYQTALVSLKTYIRIFIPTVHTYVHTYSTYIACYRHTMKLFHVNHIMSYQLYSKQNGLSVKFVFGTYVLHVCIYVCMFSVYTPKNSSMRFNACIYAYLYMYSYM